MNVILQVVDAGHVFRGEEPGQVCRKDGEQWPCPAIRAARVRHYIDMKKKGAANAN